MRRFLGYALMLFCCVSCANFRIGRLNFQDGKLKSIKKHYSLGEQIDKYGKFMDD